jgi:hypothetical protein
MSWYFTSRNRGSISFSSGLYGGRKYRKMPSRARSRRADQLLAVLAAHKAALVARLGSACPDCGGPLDERRRCWRCCQRLCCDCGRPTGTAFVARCFRCGALFKEDPGDIDRGDNDPLQPAA